MFETDFSDHKVRPDERCPSQEDKRFVSKMEQDIRLINGHYEIPLPFGRKSEWCVNAEQLRLSTEASIVAKEKNATWHQVPP